MMTIIIYSNSHHHNIFLFSDFIFLKKSIIGISLRTSLRDEVRDEWVYARQDRRMKKKKILWEQSIIMIIIHIITTLGEDERDEWVCGRQDRKKEKNHL